MPVCLRMRRNSSRRRMRSLASRLLKRLVEQQELRPVDEASRQRHALHLAARQRVHRPLGIFAETDQLERLVDLGLMSPPAPLRGASADRPRSGAPSCAATRHRTGTPCRCRARAAAPARRVQAPTPRARRSDAAAGGVFEPGDAAQRRGLAAARGPEQDHDLARRHIEAHAVHGGPAVVNSRLTSPSMRSAVSLTIAVGLVPLVEPGLAQLLELARISAPRP